MMQAPAGSRPSPQGAVARGCLKRVVAVRRYLVVANQTLQAAELRDELRKRISAGPCSFFVIVPDTKAAQYDPVAAGGVLPQPGMWWWATYYPRPATGQEATAQTRERLSVMLAGLAALGGAGLACPRLLPALRDRRSRPAGRTGASCRGRTWTAAGAGHTIPVRGRSVIMRFTGYSFGSIRVDGVTYDHDLVIDRGKIRKRKKAASRKFRDAYGHTPLSAAEDIPWRCRRLVIGTGADGALPVMQEVRDEASRREIDLAILPTAEAVAVLTKAAADTNAILHLTC
jgi:hypothetical protein